MPNLTDFDRKCFDVSAFKLVQKKYLPKIDGLNIELTQRNCLKLIAKKCTHLTRLQVVSMPSDTRQVSGGFCDEPSIGRFPQLLYLTLNGINLSTSCLSKFKYLTSITNIDLLYTKLECHATFGRAVSKTPIRELYIFCSSVNWGEMNALLHQVRLQFFELEVEELMFFERSHFFALCRRCAREEYPKSFHIFTPQDNCLNGKLLS